MKTLDQTNWQVTPEQFSDLASSLNNFFNQAGIPLPTTQDPNLSKIDTTIAPSPLKGSNLLYILQWLTYVHFSGYFVQEILKDIPKWKGGNNLPYVPKSRLFWRWFGSRYVEAAYDTTDLMLI